MSELNSLINLHETNERLMEIDELKGGLPSLLTDQKSKLQTISTAQKENQKKIDDLSKESSSNQNLVTDNSSKLDQHQDQLFKVTNNKEYDALLLETDHLKNAIVDLNQNLADVKKQKKELETLVDTNNELIENLSISIKKNSDELDVQMAETGKEEQLLIKNKKKQQKQIQENYLSHYNKLYEKYGKGMGNTVRGSCSHCYTHLPPQTLQETEYDKKLITCPSCDVFLYYKNEEDN